MARKGLTKDIVIQTALTQIQSLGLAAFSLRTLAAALGIQVSSLYNHIEGYTDLIAKVGLRAAEMLAQQEEQAIEGLEKDEALFALAKSYLRFTRENRELYRVIMGLHNHDIPILECSAITIAIPMQKVMSGYGLDIDMQVHFQRMLRSVLHGFYVNENLSGFTAEVVDVDESYRLAIECIAARLNELGNAEK